MTSPIINGSTVPRLVPWIFGALKLESVQLDFRTNHDVLWGTDSIWYGSPQNPIQTFRTLQFAEPLRDQYGYPELTAPLRAKVFGLNAPKPYEISPEEIQRRNAKDRVSEVKQASQENPEPSFAPNGPRNRREFLALRQMEG